MKKIIEYKDSHFYCVKCKTMHRGSGCLYNGQPYCTKHYQELFPKWVQEDKGIQEEDFKDVVK